MGGDSAVRSVGLRRVLVTLCFTEITSWGVLYYAIHCAGSGHLPRYWLVRTYRYGGFFFGS